MCCREGSGTKSRDEKPSTGSEARLTGGLCPRGLLLAAWGAGLARPSRCAVCDSRMPHGHPSAWAMTLLSPGLWPRVPAGPTPLPVLERSEVLTCSWGLSRTPSGEEWSAQEELFPSRRKWENQESPSHSPTPSSPPANLGTEGRICVVFGWGFMNSRVGPV